jgi:hypothetical protein
MVQVSFTRATAVAMTLLFAEQVLGFWRSEFNIIPSYSNCVTSLTLLHSELQCYSNGQNRMLVLRISENAIQLY